MSQSTRPRVGNNTLAVIDTVIMIFLAVLWFQGFDDLTHCLPMAHHRLIASIIHAAMMLAIALYVAFAVRTKSTALAIVCGCGAHYCAFMSSHVTLHVQAVFFRDHPVVCFLGTIPVLLILVGLGAGLYLFKKRVLRLDPGTETENEGNDAFVDRFDDVETDFAAMGLAVYWVMVVQFSIMGEYPEPEIEPGARPVHTAVDRAAMLAYTVLTFTVGPLIAHKLAGLEGLSYAKSRLAGLLTSFMTMSAAFAFLTWGKMQLYEHEALNVSPIYARIFFAGMCTLVTMAGVMVASLWLPRGGAGSAVLGALGLVAGCAWEETFDASVESVVEGSQSEPLAKACLALVAAAIVLPTYVLYVKPKALKAAEESG